MAYKFRLYPTAAQDLRLREQLETLRQVYNAALQYRKDLYAEEKRAPKAGELYKVFAFYRNLQIEDKKNAGAGPHWLAGVGAVALRDTLKRVDVAFENFFRRLKQKAKKVGFPRFKSYGRLASIPFENYANGCTLRDRAGKALAKDVPAAKKGYRLDVFGAGRVKVVAHRAIEGQIKTACVERDVDGKWYVVLVAKVPDAAPVPKEGPAVGIDVGLESFLTTSEGERVENPKHMTRQLKELRRKQRSASRKAERAKRQKVKFRECRNLQKAYRDVAKLHVKVRNQRKEHHHKTANALVNRYATICAEDLNVRGMLRNSKLARAISDAGWSAFLTRLDHKAKRAGVKFVKVSAGGTSQTCPECGAVQKKSLIERRHRCPCGYETHRDHAAARVILARGLGGAGQVPVGANLDVMPSAQVGGGQGCRRTETQSGFPKPTSAKKKVAPKRAPKGTRSRSAQQSIPWDGVVPHEVGTEN